MDLSSRVAEKQARVVCIPYPAQSHIKAMLKMAKLLHSKNIFITVVNTEFNHKRFLKSRGLQSLDGLPSFRFETIPDGLPPSHVGATQEIPALNYSIKENNMLPPFQSLLEKLNAATYPVTSILSDGFMTFTADAAHSPGCPIVLLWTIAACGLMGFYQFKNVLDRGLVPFKDESSLTQGLDTIIDWIPGMPNIRLGDLSSHVRILDSNDFIFNFIVECTQRATSVTSHVLLTFDDLERELLDVFP